MTSDTSDTTSAQKDPTACSRCGRTGVKNAGFLFCPDCTPGGRTTRLAEKDALIGGWLRGETPAQEFRHSMVIMQIVEQALDGTRASAAPAHDQEDLRRYIAGALATYQARRQGEELGVALRVFEAFLPDETRLRAAAQELRGVLSGWTDPHTAQGRAQVARTVGVVQTLTAGLVRHPLLPVLISPLMVVGDAAMVALALCGAQCDNARITPLPAGVDALAVVDQQTAACAESAAGAVFSAWTWLSVEGSAESVAAFERILDPGADDEAVRRARLHYVTEATRQMGD